MPYVLYARRSQEREERQVQSIDDQLRLTRELAARRGLTVLDEVTESRSAKEPGQRPGFARLLSLVERGRAEGILAWHPDRLSRNELDAAKITYLVRKGRLRLEFVNYAFDPSPEGILMLQMALSQSQYYSAKLAADVWRGMQGKIARGWCPFRAPEGYRNDAETRTVMADPERFALIRRAWDLLLTGAYTVPEVVERLNDGWGYTTRPSKGTRPSARRHGGGPLSLSSAYKLFHSPYYTGHFVVNGVIHQGNHPPMVTAAEFHRVQQLLARAGKRRTHRGKHEYAYTGLIRCKGCGGLVTAEVQPGRYKPGRYVYYHCGNRRGTCSRVGLREEALEAQVEGLLGRITLDAEVAERALAAVARWREEECGGGAEEVSGRQRGALAEAERQLGNLLDLRLRELIGDGAFREKQAELTARAARLRQAAAETAEEFGRVRSSAVSALRFLGRAREKFLVGSVAERREIARALGVVYTFDRGTVEIEPHPALLPHLTISTGSPGYDAGDGPKDGPKDGAKNGPDEHAVCGSGSTKKAAGAAAFSCGGPEDTLPERLWQFFSVKPRFAEVPCLADDVAGLDQAGDRGADFSSPS